MWRVPAQAVLTPFPGSKLRTRTPACKAAVMVPPWEMWGDEASGQRGPFQGPLGGQPAGFMSNAASECGHLAPQ